MGIPSFSGKLASIFVKKSDGKEADDDVIIVDPQIASIRKKFLMSSVPDQIRKQQVLSHFIGEVYEVYMFSEQ